MNSKLCRDVCRKICRNVTNWQRYKDRELLYKRRDGLNGLYKCDNSVLKQFDTFKPNYRNEYNILSKVKHSNIITVTDHFYEKDHFYLVFPYYKNGDLWEKTFSKHKHFSRLKFLEFALKITRPITHIHNNGLVHLDIKLENYVENDNNNFILIDFEYSKWFNKEYNQLDTLENIVGTPRYIAPEIYNLKYGPTSDVFSLGVVLYAIITRTLPDFENIDWRSVRYKMPEIEYLIKSMLHVKHTSRPTIFEVYKELHVLRFPPTNLHILSTEKLWIFDNSL